MQLGNLLNHLRICWLEKISTYSHGSDHDTGLLWAPCGTRCKDPSFRLVLGPKRRVYLLRY